jgi:2,3-bisphosphoglycerate-independent phosphoglycerate mutase
MKKTPMLLAILDGWGIGKNDKSNAVFLAKTPNLDYLLNNYPKTRLATNGNEVGLPDGVMGNSEVGHQNIGAGRIIYQALVKINLAIKNEEFYQNKAIDDAFTYAKNNNTAIHFMGLLSDGGVHSDISHLFALLKKAKRMDMKDVYIHVILDGRDTHPNSGIKYLESLMNKTKEIGIGKIASISGRYYAMDRDNNYDKILKAYEAIVKGNGAKHTDPIMLLKERYDQKETDEFIIPTNMVQENNQTIKVKENDAFIFFNFRPDRAREISKALLNKVDNDPKNTFKDIETPNIFFASFTEYQEGITKNVAFPPDKFINTLGEVISNNNLKQLRIAETEKYAHVTFFFNGGSELVFENEERVLIPSPKEVDGYYDRKPEMSAIEITNKLLEIIKNDTYDLIVLNFANMDMVGHTGKIDATIQAVETVDSCIGKIINLIKEKNGTAIVTADHGNADHMLEDNGEPMTSHSMNDVPLVLISESKNYKLKANGKLADIAPTILELMNISKPVEMTGETLLKKD